ncbi:MAG: MFS transporter [Actinobacteria bacterium]|nr:MFS transporter [Actinomycetota bacterium]
MEDYIGSTSKIANKFNKFPIFLSAVSHLITDLYASFVVGLIPILASKFGLSLFMISILSSVNQTANSLTQPLFGYLADKRGFKYYLVSGPLFSSLLISLLGILPNYYVILVFLFLGNLSIAAFHPPSAAIAGHFGGDKRTIGNSIISFGGNLGYSLGSLFVIFVVERLGLKFTPITMLPGVAMAFILLRLMPSEDSFRTNKSNARAVNSSTYLPFRQSKIGKAKATLLFLIWFVSFSRDLTWIALLTFMPIYFTKANINLTNIGYVLLLFGLVGGIGGLFSGYYSVKFRNVVYIIQIGLAISIPLIYLIFKVSGISSIVLFIVSGFFLVSTLPLCINLSQEILPTNMSFASSLVMGLSSGAAGIAIIFLGKVADHLGIVKTIQYTLSLPVLAFLLLFAFSVFKKRLKE